MTRLVDDLDGSSADQTVEFSFNGTSYEIDLTEKHTDQMRKALQPWLDKARRQGRVRGRRPAQARRPRTVEPTPTEKRATNEEIRAWAKENGLKIAEKGRIPNAIIEQYKSA